MFTSVSDRQDAIKLWATHWNDDPKPFVWQATADDIITKVRRGRATLTHRTNTRTDHYWRVHCPGAGGVWTSRIACICVCAIRVTLRTVTVLVVLVLPGSH